MLEKEFQYYLDHQKELVDKYSGKILVIVGEEVVGVYEDQAKAYLETIQTHKPGTFLIQRCSPGDKDYTQTFHSRVSFV